MVRLLLIVLSSAAALFGSAAANPVEVCEAVPSADAPSGYETGECEMISKWQIDPEGRLLWFTFDLDMPEPLWTSGEPLGLAISAKASSALFIGGERIASNGEPAATRDDEAPGRIDAVLHVPRDRLRPGSNEVRVLMSSHHGFLDLASPFHGIRFVPYRHPGLPIGPYVLAFVAFGAFVSGGLYFTARAISRAEERGEVGLLAALCFFAGGQMAAEYARALVSYPYPLHDARLLAVTGCALGFGLSLFAYTSVRLRAFRGRRSEAVLGGVALLTLLSALMTQGYDGKGVMAILVPSVCSVVLAGLCLRRETVGARSFVFLLSGFCALILAAPYTFLDQNFYIVTAGVLLFLFVQQARLLTEAQRERASEAARAAQLSAALSAAEARQRKTVPTLSLAVGSSIETVPIEDVVYCKAAGDYVEVHLRGGEERLASRRMAEIENCAPGLLLRVHRSFIVNLSHVRSLDRASAGTGSLTLADGSSVPVSRRIMPTVREKLTAKDEVAA